MIGPSKEECDDGWSCTCRIKSLLMVHVHVIQIKFMFDNQQSNSDQYVPFITQKHTIKMYLVLSYDGFRLNLLLNTSYNIKINYTYLEIHVS